ncbi:unnamed protein product [Pipistrellus nathusii]|uniref:Uncharacterized protein n=1 Tax=Pipistrellus nathusii TaxID=59473 RepID=A0ABP0A6Z0_PIPNA
MGPGVPTLAGHGGCPGAEPAMLRPCAAKIDPDSRKEGLYLKGSLQDWEREYFSQENAQASRCPGCPPPRAPKERPLLSQGGVREVYSGTILCSAFWGRSCMLG